MAILYFIGQQILWFYRTTKSTKIDTPQIMILSQYIQIQHKWTNGSILSTTQRATSCCVSSIRAKSWENSACNCSVLLGSCLWFLYPMLQSSGVYNIFDPSIRSSVWIWMKVCSYESLWWVWFSEKSKRGNNFFREGNFAKIVNFFQVAWITAFISWWIAFKLKWKFTLMKMSDEINFQKNPLTGTIFFQKGASKNLKIILWCLDIPFISWWIAFKFK